MRYAEGRNRESPRLAVASVVLGPALMSIGDLLHPAESWDPAVQVAILADSSGGWYVAHLLLFIGLLVFVPGVLELTRLGAGRKPVAAYAARVLLIVAVGALSAVFIFEVLLGRFILDGAGEATATMLLRTFQSAPVFLPLAPGLLAFFASVTLLVWSLAPFASGTRWPAMTFMVGAALILAEIVSAQVVLSQIGNILILVAGTGFARLLLRKPDPSAARVEG